jgi:AraC family transcriptional activator of pyochelin receptor
MESKNNAKRTFWEYALEPGFELYCLQQDAQAKGGFQRAVNQEVIQFHFCLKGRGDLQYNGGAYTFSVYENHVVLLYNPQKSLPIDLVVVPDTWMLSVVISIKKFHSLFSNDAGQISFLSPENSTQKFYDDRVFSPATAVVLSQLLQCKVDDSVRALYLKAKVYELFSLYFDTTAADLEQCPFLENEDQVRRIRQAKTLLLEHMAEPPTLQELSHKVGINIKKLKEGFKQLYGQTVYGFLLDHKMDEAQRLLATQKYNVNEVGLHLGYSTSSHFIAAFKKKFGTTPKKFLMSVSS